MRLGRDATELARLGLRAPDHRRGRGVALCDTPARRHRAQETGDETVLLTEALGEAVERIRQQERETHARAEASERLSDQIIDSLASRLLVVDVAGAVQILNPAGRRLLGVTAEEQAGSFRNLIGAPRHAVSRRDR